MLLNTVYLDTEKNIFFRIIFQNPQYLWIMNLSDDALWPELIEFHHYENNTRTGIFTKSEDIFRIIPNKISENDLRIREEAYEAISSLLDGTEKVFFKNSRNKLIKKTVENTGKTRIYIIRQLRRYWQRGLNRNALLPDLRNSGAKGFPRRQGKLKNGRKRIYSKGEGIFITDEIAEMFELVVEKLLFKNQKMSLMQAYSNHFVGIYRSKYPKADETNIPSYNQFSYYYRKNYKMNEVVKKRTSNIHYDKDIRALTSTSGYMNFGPGDRYEIDATIGDIYLVAEKNPEKIIGRPVIYFVRDVFSRMITGLYVGLENPSWVAAMIAMANAFSDKVAFCSKYGIEITSDEWPCYGLPASIMADKGELLSKQADVLVNALGIQLSNSRSFRADDKGGTEGLFLTVQAVFKPYAGGIVEPINGKKRLGKDYRLDATMSLAQFTRMMIRIVLHKNHNNVVKGYDFAEDMPTELAAVPIDLWNWGVQHRTGRLRPCDDKYVWMNLLPTATGTVSEEGIGFKGMKYGCSEAFKLGWFDRFKQTRPQKVVIAFDPRSTNTAYLNPNDGTNGYWECNLADKSRRFKSMSFSEAATVLKEAKTSEANANQKKNYLSSEFYQELEKIIEESRRKSVDNSKAKNCRGIKENRQHEKKLERLKIEKIADMKISEEKISECQLGADDDFCFPSANKFLIEDD